ncbi:hypothetical protein M8J76_012054 [Diaphorina citri]|nr:hypothetical protein M8J75_000736 [Diaphorina citri]KAI5719574.1 hypothetical protein M8J76_012054 [Diaphorina citri]KAI5720431.1 hypothetical protein M8J77_006519 [Diaphorina citri]
MPAEAAAGKLPKPQLRNLLQSSIKVALVQGAVIAFGTAVAWKVLIMDPHKKAISEFYKTYDGEKDFERMKKAGLFEEYTL